MGRRGIELAVLNPKMVNRFAADAAPIQDRCGRCGGAGRVQSADGVRPAWQRPSRNGLQLRALGRHIGALLTEQTREQQPAARAQGSQTAPRAVVAGHLKPLAGLVATAHSEGCGREARAASGRMRSFDERFRLLAAIPGIADVSAVQILGRAVRGWRPR